MSNPLVSDGVKLKLVAHPTGRTDSPEDENEDGFVRLRRAFELWSVKTERQPPKLRVIRGGRV